MSKELTKRQALFILIICFVANKTQRLPCLISASLGRHGWLVTLILGLVEVLMLCLFLFSNQISGGHTCYQLCEKTGGKLIAKVVSVLFATYFLLNALLPYEAVHEVFSNVLFDHLSWELYSIFIVFALGFFATRGLRTIGRMNELFVWLVLSSLLLLLLLGGFTTNFARILPICDIDLGNLFSTCSEFSMWFGDFLIMYLLMGRVQEEKTKMNFWFAFALFASVLVMSFAYVIFYGLYGTLSSEQTNAISAISQFSLLSLDIGRVDWFLVLFFEFSTFISSGIYIYASAKFFSDVFAKKHKNVIAVILVLLVFVLDIFVFKSVGLGVSWLAKGVKFAYPFFVIGLPIIVFVLSLVFHKKHKKVLKTYPQMQKYQTMQRGINFVNYDGKRKLSQERKQIEKSKNKNFSQVGAQK